MSKLTTENHCVNTALLNRYLAEEDKHAELFDEWQKITQHHFEAIEEQIFHINNKSEAFSDLDLEDEIKSRVAEFLPKSVSKKEIEMLALLQIANKLEHTLNTIAKEKGLLCTH